MEITDVKAEWREERGFSVNRPDIGNEYIFIHFLSPAVLYSSYCDIPVHSGACILYNKHTAQHFSAPDNEVVFDWFHLKGDLSQKMQKYDLDFNCVYYPANSFSVTEIIRSMEREFLQPNAFSQDFYDAKTTDLLLALTRNTHQPTAKPLDKQTRTILESVRKTILNDYTKAWDIDEMASLASMHRSAFCNAYKQFFGIAPKQDLISCRIQHAKFMLLRGDLSVEQVAKACGYTNASHFIRQFKAQTGATPKKFICL